MDQHQPDTPCSSRASSVTLAHEPTPTTNQTSYPASNADSPIILDDDNDSDTSVTVDNDPDTRYYVEDIVEVVAPDLQPNGLQSSNQAPQPRKVSVEAIDLTSEPQGLLNDGDYLTDECLARLAPVLGRNEEPAEPGPTEPCGPRAGTRDVPEACVQGILYKPGQSLELYDNSYLRVTSVLEDSTGLICFRGRRLFKLRDLVRWGKGYLPVWRNELLWVVSDDSDVPLALVKRFVGISFTNCIKAEKAQWEHDPERNLFCRLKEVTISDQISIQYLSHDEADESPSYRSHPWELRQQWRGSTRPFGDADKDTFNARHVGVIDLEQDHSSTAVVDLTEPLTDATAISRLSTRRQYTFGDAFCGAGGVSSGARKAGFSVKWGFDKSVYAMETYRRNFKTAVCETSDIFHFLTNDPGFMRVDICHGSPPCQTFSPAKTVECAHDDANFACIFSCADLMKKAKPRVLTMEETSGLYERHRDVFDRVIQGFLEIGYSVNWRMLHCEDYGVPQCRRRLIVIASGPGEALPAFPQPSHGPPGSGLLPQATINSIITNIPPNARDHDVEAALLRGLRGEQKRPFDAEKQAMTITTGGGGNNYHPSGKRGFTNREFACLQTFDTDYRFGRQEVRKQIGNAVPPILAKALYREIIKSLKRTDSTETAERVRRGSLEIDEL